MNTCSNCGATVRPGAKFCTACGTRLNDVDSSASGSSGWGESTPVEDTPAATEPPVDDATSTQGIAQERPEMAPDTSSTPSTAWTWGSSTSDDPAERTPVTPAEEDSLASPNGTGVAPSSPAAPASTGNFQWSWGSSSASDADESREFDEPSTDDDLTGTAVERDNADVPQAAGVVENGESRDEGSAAEGQVGQDGDDQEAGPESSDTAPAYDWRQSSAYGYGETPAAQDESGFGVPTEADGDDSTPAVFADSDGYGPSVADSTDVQARAVELLDELRSLIPALGATSDAVPTANVAEPAGQSLDTQGVISDLERARSGISESGDLRSALEAAQSRPRDMDVILDLVGRAGSLIDLLDERDRLAAAIERALSSLR